MTIFPMKRFRNWLLDFYFAKVSGIIVRVRQSNREQMFFSKGRPILPGRPIHEPALNSFYSQQCELRVQGRPQITS